MCPVLSAVRRAPLAALLLTILSPTVSAGGERDAVASWVEANRAPILAELREFLSLPNVAVDPAAMNANADHLVGMLRRRGLEARILGDPPYVYARLAPPAAAGATPPVVLFYCHFDGQPVDPSRWTVGEPFAPTLRGEPDDPEARLYARSASDDKAPIVALLAALDALRSAGLPPTVEAKFLFDPEEEIGSPHIREMLRAHREALQADLMIFADGPVHQSGHPTLVFGTRGIVTLTLTVYGAAHGLHSGHYGNWAPNPAEKLAELLATMKDDDGQVLVEGFYDDVEPLSARERAALAAIPPVEATLMDELLIPRPDGAGASLQERINLPSLNVRGMASAWVGDEARTIVPSEAVAEIDLRLVKSIQPADQVERVRAHVRAQGYHVVDDEPSDDLRRRHPRIARITASTGVPATRSPMDTPISRALIEAITRASASDPILMPTLGGTGPLFPFEAILDLPTYGLPIVNHDNNQHAPDENLRLANLWTGIPLYAALLRLPPIKTPGSGPR